MSWIEKTSKNTQALKNLTPLEANAVWGKLRVILGNDTALDELADTGRPLAGLVSSIRKLAETTKGHDVGNIEVHDQRLAMAGETIARACDSPNALDQQIGTALMQAIDASLPYVHVVKPIERG